MRTLQNHKNCKVLMKRTLKILPKRLNSRIIQTSLMKKIFFCFLFFVFLIGVSSAVEEGSLGSCCRVTIDGHFCQSVDNTGNGFCLFPEPTPCEQIDACELGQCYTPENGQCGPSTQQECASNPENKWDVNFDTLSECKEVCCKIGAGQFPSTRGLCNFRADIEGVPAEITDATSPEECIGYSETKGACLLEETSEGRNCQILPASECGNLGGEHYPNYLCTHSNLEESMCTPCASHSCVEDENLLFNYPDVYCYDSCGNMENVYLGDTDSMKTLSWSEGYIQERDYFNENVCSTSNDCGKCDYQDGYGTEICSEDESSGDAKCDSINCKNAPWKYTYNPDGTINTYDKKDRQNGESWCVYETRIGEAVFGEPATISTDPPGSEHYKLTCQYGKVSIIPCGTARSKICAEEIEDTTTNRYKAECRFNKGQDCFEIANTELCEFLPDCRVMRVDVGEYDVKACGLTQGEKDCIKKAENVWVIGASGLTLLDSVVRECISSENDERPCIEYALEKASEWRIYDDVDDENHFRWNSCVPKYPRGNELFADDTTADGGYEDVCNVATKSCTATRTTVEAGKIDGRVRWANRACEVDQSKKVMNQLCLSVGDCGSYVNYVGEGTSDGFSPRTSGDIFKNFLGFENVFEGEEKNIPTSINSEESSSTPPEDISEFEPDRDVKGEYIRCPPLSDKDGVKYSCSHETSDTKFQCKPWEPPYANPGEESKCNLCNEDDPKNKFKLPCTEYKCKSLGEGCAVIPKEDVEEEKVICYSSDCESAEPDIALLSIEGFEESDYSENSEGLTITPHITEGTQISFTIETDRETKCKLFFDKSSIPLGFNEDIEDDENYNPDVHFKIPEGGEVFSKKHTFIFSARGVEGIDESDKQITYYVACEDVCRTPTSDPYYKFDFWVTHQIDFTAPEITKFTPEQNSFLAFNVNETELTLLLSERGTCKYSKTPNQISFENMEVTMNCNIDSYDYRDWTCNTYLDELNQAENKIYIRCSNTDGYMHDEDIIYTLKASLAELKISSVKFKSPHAEIFDVDGAVVKDDRTTLSVVTEGGMVNDGVSTCKTTFIGTSWPENTLGESDITIHEGEFSFPMGAYILALTCSDSAGNIATNISKFSVERDNEPPIITRAYKEGDNLVLWTNEKSICYYNFTGCAFDTETSSNMGGTYSMKNSVSVSNNLKETYYVRCKDQRGNINPISSCAIVVRPMDL